MELIKLSLSGSIGIYKGLGLEELEIDFTKFNPGLLAIIAKNGTGKTTIIDNLHFFLTLPSRGGNIADHFFLKNSYRIIEVHHNGKYYKGNIKIDAITRKTEPTLFVKSKLEDKYEAITDGKIGTYQEKVESIFGSEQLFFNSAFASQKSSGIAGLETADRRKLFYEILLLNVYGEYCDIAKDELGISKEELKKIEDEISLLRIEIDSIFSSDESLNTTLSDITLNEELLKSNAEELQRSNTIIAQAQIKKDNLNEKRKQIEAKLETLKSLKSQLILNTQNKKNDITLVEAEYNDVISALEQIIDNTDDINNTQQAIDGLEDKYTAERTLLASTIDLLKNDIQKTQSKVDETALLITGSDKIKSDYQTYTDKLIQKTGLEEKASEINKQIESVKQVYSEKIETINREYAELESEATKSLTTAEKVLQQAESDLVYTQSLFDNLSAQKLKQISLIDQVPCDPAMGAKCQFLISAFTEKNQYDAFVQQHETRVAECNDKINNAKRIVEEKKSKVSELLAEKTTKVNELDDKKNYELGQFTLDADRLSIQIKECDLEIQALNPDKLQKQYNELSFAETNHDNLKSVLDSTKNRLTDKEKELSELSYKQAGEREILTSKLSLLLEAVESQKREKETKTAEAQAIKTAKLAEIERKYNTENITRQILDIEEDTKDYSSIEEQIQQVIAEELNAQNSVEALNKTAHQVNTKLQELKVHLATIKADQERKKNLLAKVAELENKAEPIRRDVKEWAFLVKAFDKTGIPVYKLEYSGHEITIIANDLLAMFDNKFRIAIDTVKEKKDGGVKEVFDITVVDDEGSCELGNKSGGQKVWIETAIQLAIMLFLRRSGKGILTAFLDEKDGALDPENAYNYKMMIETAHKLAGVKHTVIITHRPALYEAIDNKIILKDNDIIIKVA